MIKKKWRKRPASKPCTNRRPATSGPSKPWKPAITYGSLVRGQTRKSTLVAQKLSLGWPSCEIFISHWLLGCSVGHFPTSSGVSEWAREWMSAAERASKWSSAEQANESRQASGLVFTSQFLAVLNHCALLIDSREARCSIWQWFFFYKCLLIAQSSYATAMLQPKLCYSFWRKRYGLQLANSLTTH